MKWLLVIVLCVAACDDLPPSPGYTGEGVDAWSNASTTTSAATTMTGMSQSLSGPAVDLVSGDGENSDASPDDSGDPGDSGGGSGVDPATPSGNPAGVSCLFEYGAPACVLMVRDAVEECPSLPDMPTDDERCEYQRCGTRASHAHHYEVVDACIDLLCPGPEGEKWRRVQSCYWAAYDQELSELLDCYERTPCTDWAECALAQTSEQLLMARARRLKECAM